jgi:hypothetical protein
MLIYFYEDITHYKDKHRKKEIKLFIFETPGSHGNEYEDGCVLGCFAL